MDVLRLSSAPLPEDSNRVVRLSADDNVLEKADALADAALVILTVPGFADGRVFTQARLLRRRLNYEGAVLVEGDVLPDQVAFLAQVGVDAVRLPEGADPAVWERCKTWLSRSYQNHLHDRISDPVRSVWAARHGGEAS